LAHSKDAVREALAVTQHLCEVRYRCGGALDGCDGAARGYPDDGAPVDFSCGKLLSKQLQIYFAAKGNAPQGGRP
jgi:hypothetical protein